jgi:hypothetical protein
MMIASRTLSLLVGTWLVVGQGGCAMQQEQVSESLDNPRRINCHTAEGDLRVLQSEKTNAAQRLVEGATAIYPAGAVMGVVTGTEGTKLSVAIGDYNDQIDERMAEIRRKCGL